MAKIYRTPKNLFLAQRFARHASPLTTKVYTHAADTAPSLLEELPAPGPGALCGPAGLGVWSNMGSGTMAGGGSLR